jgi:hypothetical protein
MNDKKALKSRRIGFPDRPKIIEFGSKGRGEVKQYVVVGFEVKKCRFLAIMLNLAKLKVTSGNGKRHPLPSEVWGTKVFPHEYNYHQVKKREQPLWLLPQRM